MIFYKQYVQKQDSVPNLQLCAMTSPVLDADRKAIIFENATWLRKKNQFSLHLMSLKYNSTIWNENARENLIHRKDGKRQLAFVEGSIEGRLRGRSLLIAVEHEVWDEGTIWNIASTIIPFISRDLRLRQTPAPSSAKDWSTIVLELLSVWRLHPCSYWGDSLSSCHGSLEADQTCRIRVTTRYFRHFL